jgi:hypothetical protein
MEKMFDDLEILERWYKSSIINIDEYFKIKSSIVDFYNPKKKQNNEDDLPF